MGAVGHLVPRNTDTAVNSIEHGIIVVAVAADPAGGAATKRKTHKIKKELHR